MAVYIWKVTMGSVVIGQFDLTNLVELILKCSPSIRDFIIVVVSIVGACTARSALSTWQRQLHGSTEYELSRRILKSIYRVRDSIKMVRNPFMGQPEIEAALRQLTENTAEGNVTRQITEATILAYNIRWGKLADNLRELEVECLESEVFWKREVHELVQPLHDAINELHSALRKYLRERDDRAVYSAEDIEEIERIVFGFSFEQENDAFAKRVQAAIIETEKFLSPNYSRNT